MGHAVVRLAGFAAAVALVSHAPANAHSAEPWFYFIGGPEAGRWCALPTKAALLAVEESLHTDEAYIFYRQGAVFRDATGALTGLTVSVGPESGDWAMTDHYDLRDAEVAKVRREVGYADGSPLLVQVFLRRHGRLVRASSRGGGYQPVERPYDAVSEAPFYAFVRDAVRRTPLPKEGYCAPAAPEDKPITER